MLFLQIPSDGADAAIFVNYLYVTPNTVELNVRRAILSQLGLLCQTENRVIIARRNRKRAFVVDDFSSRLWKEASFAESFECRCS